MPRSGRFDPLHSFARLRSLHAIWPELVIPGRLVSVCVRVLRLKSASPPWRARVCRLGGFCRVVQPDRLTKALALNVRVRKRRIEALNAITFFEF